MPTVKQWEKTYRAVAVKCPLCGEYIARDALAWRVHMEAEHSANSDSWADTKERGGEEGPADKYWYVVRWPQKCYGCGSTFATASELVAHLSSVHGAS